MPAAPILLRNDLIAASGFVQVLTVEFDTVGIGAHFALGEHGLHCLEHPLDVQSQAHFLGIAGIAFKLHILSTFFSHAFRQL